MTEKQMISTLKGLTFGTVVGSKGVEALEMAIKALSQEPCDDAISREAVREILEKYHLGESRIAEELNELPSVQRTSNADKKHVENTLDDAISRKAVLKLIHHKPEYGALIYAFDVEQLPSVTQKSGKWIDINGIYAECSNCNEEIYITGVFKYCPNCGAKMERSDKA